LSTNFDDIFGAVERATSNKSLDFGGDRSGSLVADSGNF